MKLWGIVWKRVVWLRPCQDKD